MIVDDSRSIRSWLRHLFTDDPRLTVVAEAGNSVEARDILRNTNVDVMTLDVDMPGLSGIEFLARVMRRRPLPVVMLSAFTSQGQDAMVKALSVGAVDCIEKPRSALDPVICADICERVFNAARYKVRARTGSQPSPSAHTRAASSGKPWTGPILLLGASTGGVAALEQVLAELDDCDAPVVIAQHMPDGFLSSFSQRLGTLFSRRFTTVVDGLQLESRQGILALGRKVSTRLEKCKSGKILCRLAPPSENSPYRPCVDDLFSSAAVSGVRGAAALLTGMGRDGAQGLLELRTAGLTTFAQSKESCVVYGMPKAAVDNGAAEFVLGPQEIGRRMAALATGPQAGVERMM